MSYANSDICHCFFCIVCIILYAIVVNDFTIRPQVVDREWNPGYHKVLRSFEKASGGVGGFLNTSFNLHGDPVVCSPRDAVYTFENSGLDQLALGNWLIKRK